MTPAKQPADALISISEVGEILNREIGTIRKWEREGKLPKHLLPQRGQRGRRYWTHAQVHGKRGLVEWMRKHEMRPGRAFSDPKNEAVHVRNLRRPKYVDDKMVVLIKTMVKNKRSAKEIVDEVFPHTKYSSKENCERALRNYFKKQGWVFPA